MPNLGRLDGDPSLGAAMYSSEATLADLPGLIEGAHLGKVIEMLQFFTYQLTCCKLLINSHSAGFGS